MKNQKGFSLVELVVVMAIIGIFGVAILGFFFTGTNSYKNVSQEANVQYDAQLCVNQIENMIIDTTRGITYQYSKGGSVVKVEGESDISGDPDDKTLVSYDNSNVYNIRWNAKDNKLYLRTDSVDDKGKITKGSEEQVMAQNISAFTININSTAKTIDVGVTFSNSDKTFAASKIVSLRNSLIINGNEKDIYADKGGGEGDPVVTDVKVYYNGEDVTGSGGTFFASANGSNRGSFSVSATVSGSNHPSSEVTWNVTGAEYSEVTTSGGKVTITIGLDESSSEFGITAISKADASKIAQTTIVLKEITGINVAVSDVRDKYYKGDTFTVTSIVSGTNLTDQEKLVNWSATGAERTNKYDVNSSVQEYRITADPGSTVSVKATLKANASYSATINPIEVSEMNYSLQIAFANSNEPYPLRNSTSGNIVASVYPDDGRHEVKWEFSGIQNKTTGKDITNTETRISLTNKTGDTTKISVDKNLDWTSEYTMGVRAYIEVGGKKIYSNEVYAGIEKVYIVMWQGNQTSNMYKQAVDGDYSDSVHYGGIRKNSTITITYLVHGYQGNMTVESASTNNLNWVSMNASVRQIYFSASKAKAKFKIKLDGTTLNYVYVDSVY